MSENNLPKSRSQQLADWTSKRIYHILSLPGNGSKAILANLRRGVGYGPGEVPALWGIIFDDFNEDWLSRTGEPTQEEWAVYIALTLFALHQQSKDPSSSPMYQKGYSLGRAISLYCKGAEDERERFQRRFEQMAYATDINGVSYHLRRIAYFLRSANIPLDYASLTRDLYQYQNPDMVANVRLRWAQDFYRIPDNKSE